MNLRIAAMLSLPIVSQAQGAITGTVRDSIKRPLGDVEVLVGSLNRRVRTDSAGRFTIGDVASGSYTMRVRRIGYFPLEKKVTVGASPSTVDLVLEKRPVMLDTVVVTAECLRFQFAGFACRRRNGNTNGRDAFFFDVDAIDSIRPRFPIDILRDIPGMRVIAKRKGQGLTVESTRDWMCSFSYIVNGKRPALENPMPQWPNEIIGVEVYPSGKDVPPEYSQFVKYRTANSCGLVNYWTVVRPRKLKSR